MHTVTISGPADTAPAASELLTTAGYLIRTVPNPGWLEAFAGEEFITVESDDPDAPVRVVDRLGWRHRASSGPPTSAMPVVALGAKGQG